MKGLAAIVLLPILLVGALNGNATAAIGLRAPDFVRIEVPGPPGLLVDPNTRIPGLVAEETPASELTVRPDPHAEAHVAALRARIVSVNHAHARTNVALGVILGLLALLGVLSRAAVIARASVLYAPAALGLGLAWRSALAIGFGALAIAFVAAIPRRLFAPLLFGVLAGALLVLWRWPTTASFATIGPAHHGRFYGMTNQVETMLLAPALAAGLFAAPLALVTVAWSKAGADGGGAVTYLTGYAVLALRSYGHVTLRRAAVAAVAVVVIAFAVVGVDAATGGSSHVTHSIGGGLPGDLAHRWRLSWDNATKNVGLIIMFVSGVLLLVAVALARPRPAVVDAMLAALVVSFVVNDTPEDVALWGALGAIALLGWARSRVG